MKASTCQYNTSDVLRHTLLNISPVNCPLSDVKQAVANAVVNTQWMEKPQSGLELINNGGEFVSNYKIVQI